MSNTCSKHDQGSGILLGRQCIHTPEWQGILTFRSPCLKAWGNCSVFFLGCLIFLFMGVVGAEGTINQSIQPDTLVGRNSPDGISRPTETKRRDPFKRIKQRVPTPMASKKTHPESARIPSVKDPVWRLLGVMHGKDGHQAVIQISPKERLVVQPGSEIAPSGWTIKSISEQEVLLEHRFSHSKVGHSSPSRNFILSFPTSPTSP